MLADAMSRLAAAVRPRLVAYPAALAVAVLCVALVLLDRAVSVIRYPQNLPRVGEREGIPWKTMRKRFYNDCLAVFQEAFSHVSTFPGGLSG